MRTAKINLCRSLLSAPVRSLLPTSLCKRLDQTLTESQWVIGHRGIRDVLLEALSLAAKAGKLSICRMVLDCGPFDNAALAEACGSSLRFAVLRGDEEMLSVLLKEIRREESKAGFHEMRALCHAAHQSQTRVSRCLTAVEDVLASKLTCLAAFSIHSSDHSAAAATTMVQQFCGIRGHLQGLAPCKG